MANEQDENFEHLSLEASIELLSELKQQLLSANPQTKSALKQQIKAARQVILRRSEEKLREMQKTARKYSPEQPEFRNLVPPMIKVIEACGEFPKLGKIDPDYEESLKETRVWFRKNLTRISEDITIVDWYKNFLLERLLYRIENSGRVWQPENRNAIYQEAFNRTRLWLFRNFHKFGESDKIKDRGTMTFAGWFTYTLTRWILREVIKDVKEGRLGIRSVTQGQIVISLDAMRNRDGEGFDGWETTLPPPDYIPWAFRDPAEQAARLETIQAFRNCIQNCDALGEILVDGCPEITCQKILLLHLPDPDADPPRWREQSLEEIAQQYNVEVQKLWKCFNQHLKVKNRKWLRGCLGQRLGNDNLS